ncbi:hypothetical protein PV327_011232 [Microctonus hyperodae]|uniref:Exonuclease domain-containing protein n=1 Tax=Microctonus hyperodae TaxID=165561 RepID=A0AA39F0I7_MICHY|nr:hypothetical protein PV327_011232 [Microctonus hyperodae]
MKRKALRTKNASSEGVQYESNCEMEIDPGFNNISSNLTSLNNVTLCVDKCSIVYFDLETSGFQKNANIVQWRISGSGVRHNILQIAAKSENTTFNVYVTPTKPVDVSASKITGLQNIDGCLFVHGKEVHTLSITEALVSFLQFLISISPHCLLVAHNARFDSSHLIHAIITTNMVDEFSNVLIGFTDTLNLFKRNLPERKGRDMFKLESLAQDILQINSEKFHDATYDVEILNKLVTTLTTKQVLIDNHKSYIDLARKAITLPSLRILKNTVSNATIQKLATSGISYDKLSKVYEEFGHEGITDLLSKKKLDNKPLITNSKKIIHKIINYFNSK